MLSWCGVGGLGGGWDGNVQLDVLTCPLPLFMCLVAATLRMLSWGGVDGLGGGWDVNVQLDVLTCPLLLFMCLVAATLRMLSWVLFYVIC